MRAVADDGDAVGDPSNLLEAMGDVDDAGAARAEAPDSGEQMADLAIGERGRRLVQQEDSGVRADGTRDLDQLLFRQAEAVEPPIDVDGCADALEESGRPPRTRRPVHSRPGPAAFGGQRDVLRDGQIGEDRRLLVDRSDAKCTRAGRSERANGLAVDHERPGVGEFGAGDNPHERRLARAVLANERVHLAGAQVKRQPAQRVHAREGLVDRGGGEKAHVISGWLRGPHVPGRAE